MTQNIAFCGLDCGKCGAYLATKEDSDEKRAEVAKMWSKMFNAEIKSEQINCYGCHSVEGPRFNHCEVCEIRKCGLEKEVDNCALCSEYSCDKLEAFFKMAPDAKANLEKLRS